jgi:hypothetical protein
LEVDQAPIDDASSSQSARLKTSARDPPGASASSSSLAGVRDGGRVYWLLRGLWRLFVGFLLLQLVVIGAFVLVGPWWALRGGLLAGALLIAGLGLLFDLRGLDLLLEWTPAPVQRACVRVAVASHLVAAGWAIASMLRPLDPAWVMLPGSDEWSDPLVVFAGDDGFVVQTGGGHMLAWTGAGWRSLGEPPGGRAWEFVAGPDGALWTAPRGVARLDRRDPGAGEWRSLGRPPGELTDLAIGDDELLVAVGGALHRLDMSQRSWSKVHEVTGRIGGVAVGGGAALAVGSRWWSRDAAGVWTDVTPAGVTGRWTSPAVGGGWRYAWHSGLWSSDLRAAPSGRSFEPRTPPAPDLRVLVVDPADGSRVLAGSWGQGVWGSTDGGESWSALGLERVQVRSLAVDWRRGVVCAASSNILWGRGVYCRDLPSGQSSVDTMATGTP